MSAPPHSTGFHDLLANLLIGMFTPEELRWFLSFNLQAKHVALSLPNGKVSASTLGYATVEALERHGMIDDALFEALAAVRPRRRVQIQAIKRQWHEQVALLHHLTDVNETGRKGTSMSVSIGYTLLGVAYGLATVGCIIIAWYYMRH